MTVLCSRPRWRQAIMIATAASLGWMMGCDPEIPQEARPTDRVSAVFDPATGTLPLPNDAAKSGGPTLPALPGAGEASAEGSFGTWFSEQYGWPTATPIVIPFSGPLNEETISSESVLLYRVTAAGLEKMEDYTLQYTDLESGASTILVQPAQALADASAYAVAVTKTIEGTNGLAIGEPLAIFFAASKTPLVDENGDATISLLADDPAQAATLEGLRQGLAPLFAGVEAQGVDRDDVAMIFAWTTTDAVTVLDPATATIPIPNTLALDADGTFPNAALANIEAQSALGELERYLGSLHGWPGATPITLPVIGEVDPTTLTADSVQLWKMGADGTASRVEDYTAVYVAEQDVIALVPNAGQEMSINSHYFAFATREVKDVHGRSLVPPAPIYMALQPHDLLDAEGNSLVSRLSNEDAMSIMGVRQVLAPAMAQIEANTDLTYTDLAAVWNWFTWTDTFAVFDPSTGEIPFGNAFLMSEGTVNLPLPADASDLTTAMFHELNQRVGFSTTATGWIPLRGGIDESTLGYDSVVMAVIRPPSPLPSRLPETAYEIGYSAEHSHIFFTPTAPLDPQLQYVGLVSSDLMGANGHPIKPTPVFVFLRSPYKLFDEGASTVPDFLDDATAEALEPARAAYNNLLMIVNLVAPHIPDRQGVSLAWSFNTGKTTRPLQEYQALASHVVSLRDERTAHRLCAADDSCADDPYLESDVAADYPHPNQDGVTVDLSNIGHIQHAGEFQTVNFLDAANSRLTGLDGATEPDVGITLFVPRAGENGEGCQPPYNVAISQHGLGQDRLNAGYGFANELAAFPSCLATVAMDFPFHGGRASAAESLHPASIPATSGAGFFTANLLLTKANFMQSVVDLFVLSQIIKGDEGVSGLEALLDDDDQTTFFNGDNIVYVGGSLGGLLGTLFVTLDPNVTTSVLALAGAKMTLILEGEDGQGSAIGAPLLAQLAEMGVEAGTFNYIQTLAFIQWMSDHIDPFTFAPYTSQRPLDALQYEAESETFALATVGTTCANDDDCAGGEACRNLGGEAGRQCVTQLPSNQVLLQMAKDDPTIPNVSTELLATTIGVSLDESTFDGAAHGFLNTHDTDGADYKQAACARRQAAQWLSSGIAGTASLTADLDAATCVAAMD